MELDHAELRRELVKHSCHTWTVDSERTNTIITGQFYAKAVREYKILKEPVQKPEDTPADAPEEKPVEKKPEAKRRKRGQTQGINLFPTFLHETPQKFSNLRDAWHAFHQLSPDQVRDLQKSVKQARDYKNIGVQPWRKRSDVARDVARQERQARINTVRALHDQQEDEEATNG